MTRIGLPCILAVEDAIQGDVEGTGGWEMEWSSTELIIIYFFCIQW